MSETQEATVSLQEVEEVIAGLEQYRERLINDAMKMAKQVKLPKKQVIAQLEQHPEITKIDQALKNIRSQQVAMASSSTAE
ncbi:MAG: acetyltransferase [Merismopedia sp. SIO2A8]|nr:acetyltransferase [Symploca sp. SIO2B6]NET48248.1 acetyltransferase [Merismopedia sp. SIO2A8]